MRRTRIEQDAIRDDVFRWLDARRNAGSYECSREELTNYAFQGDRTPLLDTSRGIRNPADFDSTLTLMTSSKKTGYSDAISPEGLVTYSYQSREGGDNVKLLKAFEHGDPLVYLLGVRPGFFVALYPGEHRSRRSCSTCCEHRPGRIAPLLQRPDESEGV